MIGTTAETTTNISDLNYVSHFMDHDNIRHGVEAENKRVAEAAECLESIITQSGQDVYNRPARSGLVIMFDFRRN